MLTSPQAVSRAEFSDKFWCWPLDYRFASLDTLAPIAALEFPKASAHLPIGFVLIEDEFRPVAVQGLAAKKNVFVTADGQWKAGYIPAGYRGYPFSLGLTQDNQSVLLFDTASGLTNDTQGEVFFSSDGSPSEPVKKVLEFLQNLQVARQQTQALCATIQELDLFEPWPITVSENETERQIAGLYRIKEKAFKELSPALFERLRANDAITLIYCHLISMQHMETLGVLASQHQDPMTILGGSTDELDLEFLKDNGTISLSTLN